MVANYLAVCVTREKSKVPNQLWIRLTGTGAKRGLLLCSAYMPQENDKAETHTSAFGSLQASAEAYGDSGEVVVLEDLNA